MTELSACVSIERCHVHTDMLTLVAIVATPTVWITNVVVIVALHHELIKVRIERTDDRSEPTSVCSHVTRVIIFYQLVAVGVA